MARVWHVFIHAILNSCSHESDITALRARILYAIMTGKSINVGGIIDLDIQMAANALSQGVLGHPFLIIELCAQAGLVVTDEVESKPRQPINAKYIRRHYFIEGATEGRTVQQQSRPRPRQQRPFDWIIEMLSIHHNNLEASMWSQEATRYFVQEGGDSSG